MMLRFGDYFPAPADPGGPRTWQTVEIDTDGWTDDERAMVEPEPGRGPVALVGFFDPCHLPPLPHPVAPTAEAVHECVRARVALLAAYRARTRRARGGRRG